MSENSCSVLEAPLEEFSKQAYAEMEVYTVREPGQLSSTSRHLPTAVVSTEELPVAETPPCWLRMEDDDDSSNDLLATIDADVSFGNIYSGHKQVPLGNFLLQ